MRSVRVAYLLAAIMLIGAAVYGQRLGPLVNGVDFSGSWYPGRQQDPGLGTAAGSLVDYGGFPINEALRMDALTGPASRQTVKQQQCMGYAVPYLWDAPVNHRIWKEPTPH